MTREERIALKARHGLAPNQSFGIHEHRPWQHKKVRNHWPEGKRPRGNHGRVKRGSLNHATSDWTKEKTDRYERGSSNLGWLLSRLGKR